MMAGTLPTPQPCQTCGTTVDKTFTCIQCNNLAFCERCWPKWILHIPGAVGWDGKPHEKADPVVVHRLRQVLEPSRTEAQHETELLDDEDTTWFGFGRDASGHPTFHDYGRFAAIMGETFSEETPERFPQLASFIGETGAGKSTLIKLLIDRQDLASQEGSRYYAPVTSSNYDRIPTTGDIHLYADPSTLTTSTPLLLVDCEGLSGGEAMPKQLRHRSQDLEKDYRRLSSPRQLAWADNPQTRKREFAVSQLYPRILYTFSDVVVFVLRNPRAFESTVLDKLLRWGAASIDKSLNQPVLPHAIIVLNATESNVDDKEWDVTTATEMLLSDIHGAIMREPSLQEHVQTWRRRGRHINSTKELLECYYASITIIRIPYRGSYMLMNEQAGKLSDLIKERCAASHRRKKRVRMLANTEKLQFYLQAAYDHFAKDLDTPFDFVKEALRHSPVSRNFEGNTLNLALSIKEKSSNIDLRGNAEQIFRAIGPMIASYVMFDAVRQNLLGTAARLLDDRYAEPCNGALQSFADMYWPCSFYNPAHGDELGRCCNVRSGHNPKGHQNKQGKIIGNGDYESDLNAAEFGPVWGQLIRASLAQLQASSFRLSQELPNKTELQISSLLHRERLNELYSNILGTATDYVSYSACLCCLRELPECTLPCGHVLCLPCIQVYGNRTSRTTIEITRCPLHVRDVIASPPWVIVTKPLHAGARVLCLDGGGIRGIVQLQVLNQMEKILGPDLPIQLFFDLIVGTDTGGIVAIGLGVKKWTVNATMDKLKDICKEAFTPREMTSVPIFGALSSLYHGSLYKTQPFTKALKRYFSDQPFFGGATHASKYTTSIKVAVTATTAMDQRAVVFANYNRPDPPDAPYQFTRSDVPSKEMHMWEAARATSATPPFFKPFLKPETQNEYVGGSLHHACPIRVAHHEAKSIWRDLADRPPDILLSLGTGHNVGDNTRDSAMAGHSSSSLNSSNPTGVIRQGRGGAGNYVRQNTSTTASSGPAGQRTTGTGYFIRDPNTPLLVSFNNPTAGADRLNDLTHRRCDKTWNKFMSGNAVHKENRARYMRINPERFEKLPKLDSLRDMDSLERETEHIIRRDAGQIYEAVHRLIASTFFFDKDAGSVKQTASGFTCTGSILCRFRNSSPELKALGWFLISCLVGEFAPFFLLEATGDPRQPAHQVVLTNAVLQYMHLYGHFALDTVRIDASYENSETRISLCLQTATTYSSGSTVLPISGFPRLLMGGDGIVLAVPSQTHSVIEKRPGAISPEPVVSPASSLGSFGKLSLRRDSDFMAELPGNSVPPAELPGH
ncbi:uncharacterized protein BCR38DRAFT_445344 [Pseudomassariella vexata]|uniref:PNPLA domain-containing protein n=1 Tax=Pseudomassariella vexata TaxID=1141098 RepID=A0A1Y2DLZ5_9PEZI|nr:uncharacterized protein BCR38DRAFT_445344 [Pseudomassariella vexata]ORY59725.1 hypothetical protein BCR38DRAFT_445344 [Pseudomassariella vexata]